MILTDKEIEAAVNNSCIAIDPFDTKQLQPASYDLRIGSQGISTTSGKKVNIEEQGYFELPPGDFGIIVSREVLTFDARHVARIGLRSRYARKGILATTGPQIDPGYKGRLKIGVTNLSPHTISFPFEDDFITIEIHSLNKPSSNPYAGPYQNEEDLSADDISAVTEGDNIGFAKMLDSMRSLSKNVGELSDSVNKLTNDVSILMNESKITRWLIGAGFSILAIVVAMLAIIVALK